MTKTIIFMCVIDFLPSCVLNRIHVLRMYDVIWTENNRVSSTRKREANLQWRSYRDRSESALPGPNSQSSVDR